MFWPFLIRPSTGWIQLSEEHIKQIILFHLPPDIRIMDERKEGRWMAWSCRMNVTWDVHTGLSEILNHNKQSNPLLGACMYTKLQTQWHIQCWLNSLSHTLLHSHCSNTINISTVLLLRFWWCQLNTGLCFSLSTVFFLLLFKFNICSLGYGWWGFKFEFCRCQFKICTLGQGFCICQCLIFCHSFWCVSMAFEVH